MNKLADLIKNKFVKTNNDESIVDGIITNRIKSKNGVASMMSYQNGGRGIIDNDISNLVKDAVKLTKKANKEKATVKVTADLNAKITHNGVNKQGVVAYSIDGVEETIILPMHGNGETTKKIRWQVGALL